jgi:hypothetical protein
MNLSKSTGSAIRSGVCEIGFPDKGFSPDSGSTSYNDLFRLTALVNCDGASESTAELGQSTINIKTQKNSGREKRAS